MVLYGMALVNQNQNWPPPDGSRLIRRRHCPALDAVSGIDVRGKKTPMKAVQLYNFHNHKRKRNNFLPPALKLPDRSACAVPVLLMRPALSCAFTRFTTMCVCVCVGGMQEPPKWFWRAGSQRMPESLALSAALNGRRSQALQISTGSQTVQRPTSAAAAYYWGLHKSATSHQNQKYSPWDQSTQQLLQKDPGISPLPNMAPVEMEHCSTPHPRKKVFDILQWSFGHHQYQQIFWSSQFLLAAHGKVQATVHARGSSLATQFGKMDICDDSPPPIPGCCRCQPQLWHVWWESACILQKKTQSPRLHRPFQLASWPNGGNLPFRWPPTHVVECLEVHVSNVKWKKKQRFRRFLANGAIFYQLGNALPIQHKVHHIGGPVQCPPCLPPGRGNASDCCVGPRPPLHLDGNLRTSFQPSQDWSRAYRTVFEHTATNG